ncbi:MAG: SsrA-binding protein SmpB [Cytophagaceae bacterium]
MSDLSKDISIKNKKASFEYEFIDTYTAGIVLKGTEIKSIRQGKASIAEGYCFFEKGELWIKGMNISVYDKGTYNNHEPLRARKLLLNKDELDKLERKSEEKGLTIIPLKLFSTSRGFVKLDIALARGKKLHDKRASIKEKDIKREIDRIR